jgi:hypothetical protein
MGGGVPDGTLREGSQVLDSRKCESASALRSHSVISTIPSAPSQYCNSLCMVTSFCYQTYEVDPEILLMERSPLDELLRLR